MLQKDAKYNHSDISAMSRGTLNKLKERISNSNSSDEMIQFHYDDLIIRIEKILDPKS